MWGHSQGGHAALFAGELAARYAPELALVAVAVAAPATDQAARLRDDMGTPIGSMLTAYSLWSWSRLYHAPLPAAVVTEAMPVVDQIAGICLQSRVALMQADINARPLSHGSLQGASFDREPWRGLLARNEPTTAAAGAPLFMIVRLDVTAAFSLSLCRRGEKVRIVDLPGVRHLTVGVDSTAAAVPWMEARFDGAAVPDDCGQRTGRL